jgi:hypothetical protein
VHSFNFTGDDIKILTRREIYGTYLDSNEKDIKKEHAMFKEEWSTHGLYTGMSIINFMVFYNGIMIFHKSVDCS